MSKKISSRGANLAAGALGLAFGLGGWALAGKYTLDGWIVGLNLLLGHLHIPARVPLADGWWVLLFVPLALGYSWVELRATPTNPREIVDLDRWFVAAALWLITIATDAGSTFVGVQTLGPRPWDLSIWLANTTWAAVLWALILTFAPEALMLYAWRLLTGRGGKRDGAHERQ
jgi:hypothetical protein